LPLRLISLNPTERIQVGTGKQPQAGWQKSLSANTPGDIGHEEIPPACFFLQTGQYLKVFQRLG
ncbi:hypothetical protein, partial [Pontibacter silvestris]|uniref:hypothetical protein n=1 Tax=Pontibacter silvestris TaxID=2305183 RepID=UPI001E33FD44